MEELTLTTPSILFSAISLIMLAYTNRFFSGLENRTRTKSDPMAQRRSTICGKGCIWLARCKFSEYPACCCAWFVRCLSMWDGNWLHTRSGFTLVGDFSRYLYPWLLISVKALEYRLDNVKIKKEGKRVVELKELLRQFAETELLSY